MLYATHKENCLHTPKIVLVSGEQLVHQSFVDRIALRVAKRFRDESMARRVANRAILAKGDRVLVKNKNEKLVRVKPETLKKEPGKYQIVRKVPGRNPDGKPYIHKDKLPEPPKLPKPPLPDPMPKPKKRPKPPKPVKVPEPPKPKAKKPAPGQPGWKPTQR
jgi:hypothetical protein